MKIYVFYTEQIKIFLTQLKESCRCIKDLEIIPVFYEINTALKTEIGGTHDLKYMDLMIERWKLHLNHIKENIGSNIVFLDADCVFNSKYSDFAMTINDLLVNNDLVFQYDDNTEMAASANGGMVGVKCSPLTFSFFEKWINLIENKEDRVPGFPQTEINELLINPDEAIANIKFSLLPQRFGYRTEDCRIYHAIGVSDKMTFLKEALKSFQL